MASYVLSGYKTPAGVNSASAVKAMQRELGVKADGIWGPNTQAAYESSQASGQTGYSNSYSGGSSYSGSAYNGSANSGSGSYGASGNVYSALTPSNRQNTTFSAATPASNTALDAGNRQAGYVEHVSGYTGQGYRDDKGRYYTDYGALLREDGYFYPDGAIVSPNGMYYDNGNGWQYANHAKTSDGRYVASSSTGIAPGTVIFSINKAEQEQMRQAAQNAYLYSSANAIDRSLDAKTSAPSGKSESPSEEWQDYFDREIELYRKKLLDGYGAG